MCVQAPGYGMSSYTRDISFNPPIRVSHLNQRLQPFALVNKTGGQDDLTTRAYDLLRRSLKSQVGRVWDTVRDDRHKAAGRQGV